jgi:hypothetical protein
MGELLQARRNNGCVETATTALEEKGYEAVAVSDGAASSKRFPYRSR